MKVIIIGGGVAGLATGWRLLQAGAAVTLLERGQPGKGATWAAAGMIARMAELEDADGAELAFANYANDLWPYFAREIEQFTGRPVGFHGSGALMLARDSASLAVMQARATADPSLAILSRVEVEARLPMLTGEYSGALWSADEARVDNRALADTLTGAFLKAGGELLPGEPVVRIGYHGDLALSVSTPYGHYGADAFLLAAGAWSGLIHDTPIAPVKGEMIALAPPPGIAFDAAGPVVWGNGVYLVPRTSARTGDRLLVGATMQEAGFDTSLTTSARDELRARAQALMPSLGDWPLADHWAGLRPKSPDGLPLLGPTATPNLFVAAGQFRNGILFAPAIARMMADMILGRGGVIPAFDPRRFHKDPT